jgi:hypothetical protein
LNLNWIIQHTGICTISTREEERDYPKIDEGGYH